jgi:hypothetical protein
MALSDIVAFITAKLVTVTGAGKVLSYQPVETEPGDITAILGPSGAVHFWTVRREITTENRLTNTETERHHTITIRAYLEVNDPAQSEPVFQALIETVMTLFRQDYRIMGAGNVVLAELVGPMQLSEPLGWRVLGTTVATHYAQLSLQAQELIRRV